MSKPETDTDDSDSDDDVYENLGLFLHEIDPKMTLDDPNGTVCDHTENKTKLNIGIVLALALKKMPRLNYHRSYQRLMFLRPYLRPNSLKYPKYQIFNLCTQNQVCYYIL